MPSDFLSEGLDHPDDPTEPVSIRRDPQGTGCEQADPSGPDQIGVEHQSTDWRMADQSGCLAGRVPVGASSSVTSCDLRILMEQPTKSISPRGPPSPHDDRWLARPEWRCLPQGAVRTVHVVMVGVLGQHEPQLPASKDEHAGPRLGVPGPWPLGHHPTSSSPCRARPPLKSCFLPPTLLNVAGVDLGHGSVVFGLEQACVGKPSSVGSRGRSPATGR